jgi:hypothetical protein
MGHQVVLRSDTNAADGRLSAILSRPTGTSESRIDLSAVEDASDSQAIDFEINGAAASLEDDDEYPWTALQTWTLRDQVPRYTIQVEVTDQKTQKPTIKEYTLWRTLISEVTELSGYPISFLAGRYRAMLTSESQQGKSTAIEAPTDDLPFLDEFEFTNNGGLTGRAYGILGVADGSRIETTPVGNVQVTVPKGFVMTQDGLLYELGRPVQAPTSEGFALDGMQRTARQSFAELARGVMPVTSSRTSIRQEPSGSWDPDLAQFGALTTIVIGGALAFEALQHHLTVNVFWV